LVDVRGVLKQLRRSLLLDPLVRTVPGTRLSRPGAVSPAEAATRPRFRYPQLVGWTARPADVVARSVDSARRPDALAARRGGTADMACVPLHSVPGAGFLPRKAIDGQGGMSPSSRSQEGGHQTSARFRLFFGFAGVGRHGRIRWHGQTQ